MRPAGEDAVLRQLNRTLLGRLRLRLFREITGANDKLASVAEQTRYVLQESRMNPEAGALLRHLLTITGTRSHGYADRHLPSDVDLLLSKLEQKPWGEARFLEITDCPPPWKATTGILAYSEGLYPSGRVYTVYILNEAQFPNVARLEIRASVQHPEPFAVYMSTDGLGQVPKSSWKADPVVQFVIGALSALSRSGPTYVSVSEAIALKPREGLFPPPTDPKFDTLIRQVWERKLPCSRTRLSLARVRPHSFSFCMEFPLEHLEPVLHDLDIGEEPELLLYYHSGTYVVSDDYLSYLGYRARQQDDVPVVIMGEFPRTDATAAIAGGGAELIPKVRLAPAPPYEEMDTTLRDYLLDCRLREAVNGDSMTQLYRLILRLHWYLSDPRTTETQLHDLLVNNPVIVDPTGIQLLSEVRLGGQYRVDLAVQYHQANRRVLLIELERANLPLFTKSGRLRAHVTHAIQQVEDWLRFWHTAPEAVPQPLDPTVSPEGLVVIGRFSALSKDEQERLFHLNQTRRVQLITYDDLVARVEETLVSISGSVA